MKTNNLYINTKTKKYLVLVGSNILNDISKILQNQKINFDKCLIIVDKNIPQKFRSKLIKNLNCKKKYTYLFNAKEKNKSYKSINTITNILFKREFNRNDCVIAFGGGITGDVVSFAASIFKRGIKFINIPSTLLSQVDSSIGGKTGINNNFGKNLIGSFYQPEIVISDVRVLDALPSREILCGYAEILKSSLIDSKRSFVFLDKNINSILKLKSPYIEKAIINSCKLKKRIVEKDEKEKNLRKVLNLGHTFAHAYESALNFSKKLNHGEAVIFGINNSLNFSYNNKFLSKEKFKLVISHILKLNLLPRYKKLFKKKNIKKIIYFMKSDKKNISKKINLILFKDFGKIKIDFQISINQLKKFLILELDK
tara:strand:- start:1806 stop:2912 length:1107 start_codon:yes stop_codon:yes gene_type:complete